MKNYSMVFIQQAYLLYSGEAFRPVVSPGFVRAAYGVRYEKYYYDVRPRHPFIHRQFFFLRIVAPFAGYMIT